MNLLSMEDVVYGYSHTPVLNHVSLNIEEGEFVGITGPNGASKSTLIKIMLGMLKPWEGKVCLSKKNTMGKSLKIGYVPQQISSFNSGFPSTVFELVKSGRYSKGKWLKRLTKEDYIEVEKALNMVEMWELRDRKIGELSGGQKQKICIARMLASNPDLFILDEPATAMDYESRRGFYAFINHQVKNHGKTAIMVTHEQHEINHFLDKVFTLEKGEKDGWKCLTWNSCNERFGQAD